MGPQFSVIIPTRNRPRLVARALRSVLAQAAADLEIVVVDDGSAEAHLPAYRALEAEHAPRMRLVRLARRQVGHGPSYALNRGVAQSSGAYLAFLDDDDVWEDTDYLARFARLVAASPRPVDLHFADQAAFLGERRLPGPVWLEDFGARLRSAGPPGLEGAYDVTASELLGAHGFCHRNTTIVRRDLLIAVGGLDETIRYECDRDFYLRAIDRAVDIKYSPITVARHHVPDPRTGMNLSTVISQLERRMFQIRVLDRAILFARTPAVRAHGRRHKAYVLKAIAEHLWREGRPGAAAYYAREALLLGFGAKWLAFSAWLGLRAMVTVEGK